jgi:hypothetical protein
MPGHSRPKDGVASLAYDPGIHTMSQQRAILRVSSLHALMDPRVKPGGHTVLVDAVSRYQAAVCLSRPSSVLISRR